MRERERENIKERISFLSLLMNGETRAQGNYRMSLLITYNH